MLREIQGPAGRLEILLDEGARDGRDATTGHAGPRAAVVFAHPHPQYGGTMHTKLVFRVAKAFCRLGCAVLRFNFRGVGTSEGRFDNGPGEMADFHHAIAYAQVRYPGAEVWAAGISFGAWVAMSVGADDDRVSLILGIAPPVELYDFSAAEATSKPKFLVHGERDEVAPLAATRRFYARAAEPKDLVVIDMADHLFDGRMSEVAGVVEDLLRDFRHA